MLPRVIGHRGAAMHAPENTLAGLREAARQGCRWVEIDVRLTADDALALMHDLTVDRTTTAVGRVRELPLAELAGMDAGARFGAAWAGEAVPALADAIGVAAAEVADASADRILIRLGAWVLAVVLGVVSIATAIIIAVIQSALD